MAIVRQTTVDLIQIDRRCAISVRMALEIVEDTDTLQQTWHRILLEPGDDLTARVVALNASLTSLRFPVVATAERAKIGQVATLLWTPQVIASYQAWKATQAAVLP